MSTSQRQHIRFSLDIPARIYTRFGEAQNTTLQQISVGGCFTDWEENIYIGDEFRLEGELPNKNRLPLKCKAVYLFEGTGVGARFIDITQFEQDLVSKIISHRLELEGLPAELAVEVPVSVDGDGVHPSRAASHLVPRGPDGGPGFPRSAFGPVSWTVNLHKLN